MQLIALIENSRHNVRSDLMPEHGLSFYIHLGDHTFMSDVGKTGLFAQNAAFLGLELSSVDALAITHHHFDHGGGLERFFQVNQHARVFLRRSSTEALIVEGDASLPRYVGLDWEVLKAHADRIVFVDAKQESLPGVHLLTEIPLINPKPVGDHRLMVENQGSKRPDTFEHELVTVLETREGLIILTGCAHHGVVNMITAAQDAFPGHPIRAVIGGFHLNYEDPATIRQIGETLLEMDIPEVYTGHCTGDKAIAILGSVLGERLTQLFTGMSILF